MSDYCRQKVVRYPITKEQYKELDEIIGYNYEKENSFNITGTISYEKDHSEHYYLDYYLYYNYNVDSGEYGKVRELTSKEQDKYKEIFLNKFKEYLKDFDKTKLRYVDYCYYNCSEPNDYYDFKSDSFYDEI